MVCDRQKFLRFGGVAIVPDQFDLLRRSPASQLDKSARFCFVETTLHITAAQLVGRVELKDEILPEVETRGAIAAEAGDDRLGEAFDLQFHALNEARLLRGAGLLVVLRRAPWPCPV